jgi:hypothetical protein
VTAQYGVSITPRSGGRRTAAKLIPAHNPQIRAPHVNTTTTIVRKVVETLSLRGRKDVEVLSLRVAWAEALCRKIDKEPIASIAKPSPRLMTRDCNASDGPGFHQTSKTKSHLSTLCHARAGMRGSAFDPNEYVANCFAVYRRTAAQTAR